MLEHSAKKWTLFAKLSGLAYKNPKSMMDMCHNF